VFLIDGIQTDLIDAGDRGLQYGDGLFETIAVEQGEPQRWPQHMARLQAGCERLGISLPDEQTLLEEARTLCADGRERTVLKVIVTRGSGGRGYRAFAGALSHRILSLHPRPDYPIAWQQEGIRIRVCETRLGLQPALAGLKHLNRLEQVLARSEWDDPDIAEGLMLDVGGRVVEGTMSNLFVVMDGRLVTPSLTNCGVAGIIRQEVMEAARTMGLACSEEELSLDDVEEADELFLTNSLIGVWPVREVEGRTYRVGATSRELAAHVEQVKEA
jgi:4-amino-4-deoxychorismate lyase